ncbi:hypothetical protein ACIBCH_16125 [Amycolatopsis thailandensis]|uniref:hypothetical protein n=1 Tax=Amycolatopsis thailandensis TaxID=589330 RepID=UPI0037B8632E
MDHVAVQSHGAEPGRDGNRFVRDHPDPSGVVLHLHRERRRRVDRAVAGVLQRADDGVTGLVDDFAAAVELLVRHTAGGGPDVVAVHPHHERDEGLGAGKCPQDVLAFARQIRVVERDGGRVVGARGQADVLEPGRVDHR